MVGFIAVWQRVAFDATTVSPATCYLSPTYDADGNATLIVTRTGLWRITYNGENRPVRWENIAAESNNQTISNQTILTMSYDHMGRRREKNDQRFFYDGYLQIADNVGNTYVWDPTENVATRPPYSDKDSCICDNLTDLKFDIRNSYDSMMKKSKERWDDSKLHTWRGR